MRHQAPHTRSNKRKSFRAGRGAPKISLGRNTTNAQYRRQMRKVGMLSDYDKDGTPNYKDCRPFDKRRQDNGLFHITATEPHSGKRVDLRYPSIESARRANPNLEEFDYR